MPRIPSYDQLQVAPTSNPGVRAEAPEFRNAAGAQMQEAGQAMQRVGGVAGQIAGDIQNKANKVILDGAVSEYVRGDTNLSLEATSLLGRNALDRPDKIALPDEYGKKLSDLGDKIEQGLSNDAQKAAFRQVRSQVADRFYSRLAGHMVKQQGVVEEETWTTTIATAQERGMLLYGDETERQASLGAIRATVDEMASKRGLDQASKDRLYTDHASPMHAGIIQSLIAGDNPEAAKEYYEANSAEMTMQHRANVQKHIVSATATKLGESAVDAAWEAMGPQNLTDAVKLFDMDKQLREQLADKPDALKHARSALRERAALFNQQQTEASSENISKVWDMVDDRRPIGSIRRSNEWNELSGKEQHDIEAAIEREANTRSGTLVNELTRREKLLTLGGYDTYLELADPEVLITMSPAQIRAQRGRIGAANTEKLLKKHEDLTKPGKAGEAKIDDDAFKAVVFKGLGVDVYDKKLSKQDKAKIGLFKDEVEAKIDAEQRRTGKPMGRDEKDAMMRRELAKEVTVKGGIFSSDRNVPLYGVSPKEVEKVVVPREDFDIINSTLEARFRETGLEKHKPTPENVRRIYLLNIQRNQ